MRNRLHSICPYFAMFPEGFVREAVEKYTGEGDLVLDPFSGRGTTILESLLLKRRAAGADVNPVAFCISGAKARVPALKEVLGRLGELEERCPGRSETEAERSGLHGFFRRAFHPSTLTQLLFLRRDLRWRTDPVDRFIAALALGSLHGEMDKSPNYFSNQMPRTISTKPDYSLKYWRERRLFPRKRDAFAILRGRAGYRLMGETPRRAGEVRMCDARRCSDFFPGLKGEVRLIVTSPPYFNVTSYEEDQWLRLWLLGYAPKPTYGKISKDDRHENKRSYWAFLTEAWRGIAPLAREDAVFVCRIGAKGIDRARLTRGLALSLKAVFPSVRLISGPTVSRIKNRQTDLFRPDSVGCLYEVDYAFKLGPGSGNPGRERV
jgi:hypothetical protein